MSIMQLFRKLGSATVILLKQGPPEIDAKNTSSQPVNCANGTIANQAGPMPDDGAQCAVSCIE